MSLSVMDVTNGQYRTTRSADAQCNELLKRLGYKVRYLAARLAIARSLSLRDAPTSLSADEDDEAATPIRGQQLFGDGADPAAWLALIAQRSANPSLSKRDFQSLVAAHWKRGAELLSRDWDEAGGNLATFVTRLADLASLCEASQTGDGVRAPGAQELKMLTSAVLLPVGPIAEDVQSGEPVVFPVNVPGGSPHMAIMGGTNSGKTYTAITMLKRLRAFGDVPMLAFDFKGDLSEKLAPDIGAQVLSPPRVPVPLDILWASMSDETGLREAAGRIRDSIGKVKNSKLSGVQSDALREAIFQTLRTRTGRAPTLTDVARSLEREYQTRNRRPDELSATLNELVQFSLFRPEMTPGEFFARSWVIRLPQDSTAEVRRLVINLTLDALDRWINSQSDAPVVEGRRALRHVCMLDEAHVVLASKLPALSNLIRMSRSKGGVVMLVSQSPDDFEGAEEGFLDNMGLTVAFNTQAKAGPTRTVFGTAASLSDLQVGEALCRIRTEARTRRIVAWRP